MTRRAEAQPDLLTWRSAVISDCGRYRYRATRRWGEGPLLPAILLNPSTMDGNADDPTGRRLAGFARTWGFGGFDLVNMRAFRSPSPKIMRAAIDPFGPDNWMHIEVVVKQAIADDVPVLCAWGSCVDAVNQRLFTLHLQEMGARLQCLGKTKGGFPRHPLYVRADQPREMFP